MNIFKCWYDKAEQKVQSEVPWYATGDGSMYVDVDEFVQRECFWKQVEQFEEFRKEMEELK